MNLSNIEHSCNRFSKLSGSDILMYYAKVGENREDYLLDPADLLPIAALIRKRKAYEKITLVLHLSGGEIRAAIALMNMLRKEYSAEGAITSIVLNIAKSAGTMIFASSDHKYMHKGAALSDFTINPNESSSASELQSYQKKCLGHLKLSHTEPTSILSAITRLMLFYNGEHGDSIYYEEAKTHLPGVKLISEYPHSCIHLTSIHEEIIDKFDNEAGRSKTIIYNGEPVYF